LRLNDYNKEDLDWLNELLRTLMLDSSTAMGIPMQICDVFVPELCKVD
jgi:hypothetical protein